MLQPRAAIAMAAITSLLSDHTYVVEKGRQRATQLCWYLDSSSNPSESQKSLSSKVSILLMDMEWKWPRVKMAQSWQAVVLQKANSNCNTMYILIRKHLKTSILYLVYKTIWKILLNSYKYISFWLRALVLKYNYYLQCILHLTGDTSECFLQLRILYQSWSKTPDLCNLNVNVFESLWKPDTAKIRAGFVLVPFPFWRHQIGSKEECFYSGFASPWKEWWTHADISICS